MSGIDSCTSCTSAAASAADPGTVQGAASLLMLRRAMEQQEASATQLLDALPKQQPPLAKDGSLGTQLNIYA